MTYLYWLLMWVDEFSGLEINLEKIELIPIGKVDNAEELAADLVSKVGSLLSTYLGMTLGAHYNFVAVLDGFEE